MSLHGSLSVPVPASQAAPDPNDPMAGVLPPSGGTTTDEVVIKIDQPSDGKDVTVKLFEVDPSDSDLLAEFQVDLVAGKIENVRKKTVAAGKKQKHGKLIARFDGRTETFEVPILHDPGETESLDIDLRLELKLGKETYPAAGSTPPAPSRMRATGPVITFVTGSDGFFVHADSYWSGRSDEYQKKSGMSLEEILAHLAKTTDRISAMPYRFVNVVCHGNAHGVKLALAKGSTAHMQSALEVEAFAAKRSSPPQLARIDPKYTEVVIRGCQAGNDARLLRALSKLFAGARVFGCKHVLGYVNRGGTASEVMLGVSRHFEPGGNTSLLNDAAGRTKVAASLDDAGWPAGGLEEVLKTTDKSSPSGMTLWQVRVEPDDITDQLAFFDPAEFSDPAAFWKKEMGGNKDNVYRWRNTPPGPAWKLTTKVIQQPVKQTNEDGSGQDDPGTVEITGSRVEYDLRQLKTSKAPGPKLDDAVPEVPDLLDSNHFASEQSP